MEFLDKRVLVAIGDNDAPRQTCVNAISPNKIYVHLIGDSCFDEVIGWVRLSDCKFLDVIGPANEPASKYLAQINNITNQNESNRNHRR